jgi:flagellar protein FlaG
MNIQNINQLNQYSSVEDRRVSQPAITQQDAVAALSAANITPPAVQPPSSAQLEKAVSHINQVLRQANRNLAFSVDGETKRVIVKVIDTETGELIRQLPSEETLAISRAIGVVQKGLLLKQTG